MLRSLSICAVNRKQAPVEFNTSWSYACGPGSPPLLGLTIGQAVDR